LAADAKGQETVQCLALATLAAKPENTVDHQSAVCDAPELGLKAPSTPSDMQIVQNFQQNQHTLWADPAGNKGRGIDPSKYATCIVNQIPYNPTTSCTQQNGEHGWCYVTDQADVGTCAQAIQFTHGSPPDGATVSLQCVEATVNPVTNTWTGGTGG
jgi:hypothetical protein